MSRAIIAGSVSVMVLGLTAAAYIVTTSKLESSIHSDVEQRVQKAQELLVQNAKLEGLGLLKRVEDLSRDENLVSALRAETTDVAEERAKMAFQNFRSDGGEKTDILALIDREGLVVVLQLEDELFTITNPSMWKKDDRLKYRGLELAIQPDPAKAHMISDIWNHEGKGLMKVGVAPIVDYESDPPEVQGAVMVAYSLSAAAAQKQSKMLGAQVAFFDGQQVSATSFTRKQHVAEDTAKQKALTKILGSGLSERVLSVGFAETVEAGVDAETFLVSAGRLARFSSKGFPEGYPAQQVGAMVLISVDEANQPVGAAKVGILLVGVGAVIISLIAIWLVGRRVTGQTDVVEYGLNEIINGNIDYIFRPVGDELDGVANALNVMLARLLGRAEPGEEEYDEDGNIVQPGKLDFESDLSDKDAEAVHLAQEPEPDYYKRIFDEYIAALDDLGKDTDGVTFEGFVTKLRLNETGLTAKYQCSAIRFKVVVAGEKVSLKPVPIV